ncbi:sorbosone dehydrogenase family protein, partial [Rhizobium sp. RAF56]
MAFGTSDPNPKDVIGPNPKLPPQSQYLLPPMHLAKVVGWEDKETPVVPAGLKIQALATGLKHPRSVYVLPNGDVLAVQSVAPPAAAIKRPKDLIMGWMESLTTSGGSGNEDSNKITLLRDADGDGVAEVQETFL